MRADRGLQRLSEDVGTSFGKNRIGTGEANERDTRDPVFRFGRPRREERAKFVRKQTRDERRVDAARLGLGRQVGTVRGASAATVARRCAASQTTSAAPPPSLR